MFYIVVVHNGITYQTLSFFKRYYNDPIDGIPTTSGIYFWVYWPDFDSGKITVSDLEKKLVEYSIKNLQFPEILIGRYKFTAEIKEQKFDKHSSPLFGLSPSQRIKLINYLSSDRANIISFHSFFKEICFTRPFYVGKANNLRTRLNSFHFKGTTDVVPEILKQKIPETQIWVGYKEIPMNVNDEMNRVFEEIISRNIKPGLTKKPN